MPYLNLNVTTPRRLAILKDAAEKLNKGHNARKAQNDSTPYSWRDVRYSGLHNARARRCQLSPGMNGETRIWYCHTGQYFGRELVILSRAGLDYARQQMRDVARRIRQSRRELATDYAGLL